MTTETNLTHELKKFFPKLERIENAIKSGTPDLLLPLARGWQMTELKVEHSGSLFFQKSQLAFFVRSLEFPKLCQPIVLAVVAHEPLYYIMTVEEVLAAGRVSVTDRLVKMTVPENRPYMSGLRNVLEYAHLLGPD